MQIMAHILIVFGMGEFSLTVSLTVSNMLELLPFNTL
jgi:hypothetical protein